MRAIPSVIAYLLLSSAMLAQSVTETKLAADTEQQSGYCPQTHDLEVAPQAEYWFEGILEGRSVRMFLDRGGSGVVGLFYAKNGNWTPTFLGGEWSAAGVTLSAESADHNTRFGKLQGRLVKGAFLGSWTPEGSDHAEPVRLVAVPKPGCDGREIWKRFDDPKWPVSFSYPASWRIQEADGALSLICPDPAAMASSDEVTIYEGKGEPVGPGELVHCADGWAYGPSCDSVQGHSDLLPISMVSQQEGRTILNVDHEWRVYCSDGGYVGQGDGEDRVVLLHKDWIEFGGTGAASDIVDRLVNSVRLRVRVTSNKAGR